ncbi:hypothetical protein [Tropicimonas sp. S265A]|uniref:hypothetical protein n=1 Tax=Tropicimonas sp. S265A TaxID=3415134 RepID=UPI003C79C5CE
MDRLSIFRTLMSGAMITGALVITLFSLGYYSAWGIAISALVGFVLAWPSAYLVSRRIKRRDPEWDETRVDRHAALKPSAPEV